MGCGGRGGGLELAFKGMDESHMRGSPVSGPCASLWAWVQRLFMPVSGVSRMTRLNPQVEAPTPGPRTLLYMDIGSSRGCRR